MNLAFLAASFAGVLLAASRSLGWGLVAVLAVGYGYGVIRANYVSVFTTFMFDAAVLAFYLKFFLGEYRRGAGARLGKAGPFLAFLIAWPSLLCLVPVNDVLIQFVALRGTVWFLPFVIVASRLTSDDLSTLARGISALNLVALAGGIYIYQYGVESLFPLNSYTIIIYRSGDIAGNKFHRIPSLFMNAHAYGATMFMGLPIILDRLVGPGVPKWDRCLAAAGAVAAAGGMLMCGARTPLVVFATSLAIALIASRFSRQLVLISVALVGGGLLVAGTNERLGRINSVGDGDLVAGRVAVSANASFFELLMDYPGGAGMGTSVGTSYPYFLADVAPKQIGMENEFCRILIDQGWIGLVGWLAFVGWLHVRMPASRPPAPWRLGVVLMYSVTLACWLTAFIGSGVLSSVPGTVLLLIQMGVVVGVRNDGRLPGVENPRARAGDRPRTRPDERRSTAPDPLGVEFTGTERIRHAGVAPGS